ALQRGAAGHLRAAGAAGAERVGETGGGARARLPGRVRGGGPGGTGGRDGHPAAAVAAPFADPLADPLAAPSPPWSRARPVCTGPPRSRAQATPLEVRASCPFSRRYQTWNFKWC